VNFANIAAAEFEMSVDVIRNDLAFIYKRLDAVQEEKYREKTGMVEKEVYVITPDDLAKAKDRLLKRDLLDEILMKDTEKLGYVEEEVNKKLFYLSAISRLTGNPLSVLDISPPGTGKSFGMSSIMDLVPPDEILRYSRLSPNALYYKSEEGLRGRALYIEELVGMEESLEPIRMLH
jgi:DNA primase